jgi:hypothetical protein
MITLEEFETETSMHSPRIFRLSEDNGQKYFEILDGNRSLIEIVKVTPEIQDALILTL